MSELDELGEIALQNAFGYSAGANRSGIPGRKPRQVACGSPDHMQGENIRVYRQKNKIRTVCKLCDKARRRGAPL
jgi:hypothetical protein